jgi:hypothetical protein
MTFLHIHRNFHGHQNLQIVPNKKVEYSSHSRNQSFKHEFQSGPRGRAAPMGPLLLLPGAHSKEKDAYVDGAFLSWVSPLLKIRSFFCGLLWGPLHKIQDIPQSVLSPKRQFFWPMVGAVGQSQTVIVPWHHPWSCRPCHSLSLQVLRTEVTLQSTISLTAGTLISGSPGILLKSPSSL